MEDGIDIHVMIVDLKVTTTHLDQKGQIGVATGASYDSKRGELRAIMVEQSVISHFNKQACNLFIAGSAGGILHYTRSCIARYGF